MLAEQKIVSKAQRGRKKVRRLLLTGRSHQQDAIPLKSGKTGTETAGNRAPGQAQSQRRGRNGGRGRGQQMKNTDISSKITFLSFDGPLEHRLYCLLFYMFICFY